MREIPSTRNEELHKTSSHLTVVCKQRDPGSHLDIKYLSKNLYVNTPGDTPLPGLNGDVRPDRVWFSLGASITSIFVLFGGSGIPNHHKQLNHSIRL